MRDHVERHEGGQKQKLVRERIEQLAHVRDEPMLPCQVTVPQITERRGYEQDESEQPRTDRELEGEVEDRWTRGDPGDCDGVGEVEPAPSHLGSQLRA